MRPKQRALSQRVLVLVKISALYSMGGRERAHRIVRRELQRRNLSPRFFSELFIHLSLFLGYPAMLDGLECVRNVSSQKRRHTLETPITAAQKHGKQILERIYGQQTSRLLQRLDDLHPGLAHRIIQDAYGIIMNRVGLSLRERELINVVVLYAQGFDRQLFSHLRGAIRVGVSKKTLTMVILTTANTIKRRSKKALDDIGDV